MAGGRPTKYKKKTSDHICEQIATSSKSLKTICKDEYMPAVSTVMKWLNEIKEFSEQYARAKELQADFLAEEILEIADDGTNDYMTIVKGDVQYNVEDREVTNRSKLRVEARKWVASKLKPKKYGDKMDITSKGNELKPPQPLTFISADKLTDEQIEKIINQNAVVNDESI